MIGSDQALQYVKTYLIKQNVDVQEASQRLKDVGFCYTFYGYPNDLLGPGPTIILKDNGEVYESGSGQTPRVREMKTIEDFNNLKPLLRKTDRVS